MTNRDFFRRKSVRVALSLVLFALFISFGLAYFGGNHFGQTAVASVAPSGSIAQITDHLKNEGPESSLVSILQLIEKNELDTALQKTEELVAAYPKFRLAQLIKGDLLMARVRPLSNFGGAEHAPADRLSDLREEALARLHAYRSRPPENYVPRYLLQLQPEQKFAIVIDTQKSRLFLYQNDSGTPRLVHDYYMSQGKLGSDKMREGDKKTPLGVYYVTSSLSPKKVGDFYGTGAYPINYPNEWDKRLGRKGHGIWLHGTPSDTYSRAPKASDGCVVLANRDLDEIAKNLQIGVTPVIIASGMEWLTPDDLKSERKSLLKAMEDWRKDWESRDSERYGSHYSDQFNSDGMNREAWVDQKKKVNTAKAWIKVATENVSVFRNPGKDNMVVVNFEQNYQSNNLNNVMKKRQYWIWENERWKIVYEGAA